MDLAFMYDNISLRDPAASQALLDHQPVVAWIYMSVLGVAAFVGTLGNLLVIGTMSLSRVTTVGDMFITNLALSDLIVTGFINPFAIQGVAKGGNFFSNNLGLCRALGSICIASCVCSLLSIGCISINRYVYICHHSIYREVYTKRNCLAMCLATWVMGFLMDLPSHLGWSQHTFDGKSKKCLWDRNYEYGYTVFFVVGGVIIPLCLITACYLRIFIHMGIAKQQLRQFTGAVMHGTLVKTIRQARMMFVIFMAFTACWTPYILVLLLDRYDRYPLEVHLFSSLTAHIHASINFLIYGISNRKVREGYRAFLVNHVCCCCCLGRKDPNNVPFSSVFLDGVRRGDSLRFLVRARARARAGAGAGTGAETGAGAGTGARARMQAKPGVGAVSRVTPPESNAGESTEDDSYSRYIWRELNTLICRWWTSRTSQQRSANNPPLKSNTLSIRSLDERPEVDQYDESGIYQNSADILAETRTPCLQTASPPEGHLRPAPTGADQDTSFIISSSFTRQTAVGL